MRQVKDTRMFNVEHVVGKAIVVVAAGLLHEDAVKHLTSARSERIAGCCVRVVLADKQQRPAMLPGVSHRLRPRSSKLPDVKRAAILAESEPV